jgi:hypothetical protein
MVDFKDQSDVVWIDENGITWSVNKTPEVLYKNASDTLWRSTGDVKWKADYASLYLKVEPYSLTSDAIHHLDISIPLSSYIQSETPSIDHILDDNIDYVLASSDILSTVSDVSHENLVNPNVSVDITSELSLIDHILDDNIDEVSVSSSLLSTTSDASPYSTVYIHATSYLTSNLSDANSEIGEWILGDTYETYSPNDLLICAGNASTVEHIDVSNDTVCSTVNTCEERLGGLYASNATYSWLMGGYDNPTSVERIDNVNYTTALVPTAGLAQAQAGGGSLFGNSNCYLAGDSVSNLAQRFDTTTETTVVIQDIPVRVKECGGKADTESGWILGGVTSTGDAYTHVQKIDLATETWTSLTSMTLVGGTANHASFYRAKGIWYAGGIDSDSMSMEVNKIDLGLDFGSSGYRCMLSVSRKYPGGANDAAFGWAVAGYNLGYQTVVDRIDFSNDTTDANVRCQLNDARRDALVVGNLSLLTNTLSEDTRNSIIVAQSYEVTQRGAFISYSLGAGSLTVADTVYISGGQNYDQIYNKIYKLDLNDDTYFLLPNTSLTNRYALFGACDLGHSWYIGGIDSNQIELDLVEKLDHSNDTTAVAPSATIPSVLSNGGSFSLSQYAYVKAYDKFYQLDMATDTWAVNTTTGNEIFISGSGMADQGLFAGGVDVNNIKTDRIDVYDTITGTWASNKYQITSERFGLSATSVSEQTWFFGGTIRAQVNNIESINHLAQYADIKSSGQLSSAKSRTQAFSNVNYAWIFGGYRTSALSDLDRFNPYIDMAEVIERVDMTEPVHSMSVTAPKIDGSRYSYKLIGKVPTLIYADLGCQLTLLGIDDRACQTPIPYGTHENDIIIQAPRIPVVDSSDVGCFLEATYRETYTLDVRLSVSTYNDVGIVCDAEDPFNSIYSVASSRYDSVMNPFVSDDRAWVGGGLQISKYERIDSSTLIFESRGSTFYPRMGGASGTSAEQAWIAGGATDQNIVELFIYANDVLTTGDRTNLSVARSYLAGVNDSNYIWYWSGLNADGLIGLVDRLDKSNDVIAAIHRSSDLPRCRFEANFVYNSAYSIGGQVGAYGKNWVRYFAASDDTVINDRGSFPLDIFDHSMVEYNQLLYVFYKDFALTFEPSTSVARIKNNQLDNYTQADARILSTNILLTGGTPWSGSTGNGAQTNRSAIYDPVNDTYQVQQGMNYRRHNHWSCGYTSTISGGQDTVNSAYNAVGRVDAGMIASFESCNSADSLNCISFVGTQHDYDLSCIIYTQSGCFYTESFELGFNVDINNVLWKFAYNCAQPTLVDNMPSSSSRMASASTGQSGYLIGGSGRSIVSINYSDDSIVKTSNTTDDLCESAACINNSFYDFSFILGGTRYIEAYNQALVITNLIRKFDFETETLSNISNTTPRKITRTAASRCSDVFSYMLGGSVTELHDVTDEIVRVDNITGLCSIISEKLILPADLHQAILDIDGNIITSNGFKLDYATETVTSLGIWPAVYGESLMTQSANTLFIGGSADRNESESVKGLITIGVTPNSWPYMYDQITGIISACESPNLSFFFNQPGVFAYSYCSPILEARTTIHGIIEAIGTYDTWLSVYAVIPYLYSDTFVYIHDSYANEYSTITCTYTAFDQDVLNCITLGRASFTSGKDCIINLSVEHFEEDRSCLIKATDRLLSDIHVIMPWEQLQTTCNAVTWFPDFLTVWSDISCSLLIGGEITTRRCYMPAAFVANWDLYRFEAPLTLLENKDILTGDLIEILNKMIKGDDVLFEWETILQTTTEAFGDNDFIYSINDNRGVIANEGVLVKAGPHMQIINLLLKLRGTDMWVSNDSNTRFFINYSKQYDIDGIGHIPITGNIMYIQLQLREPLLTDMSFEFRSVHSTCLLKLIAM